MRWFLLVLILMLPVAYAGDITTQDGSILFNNNSNYISPLDYKITSKVIAVNSDGYTFSKEKVEVMGTETTCVKTQSVTNATTGEKTTACLTYEEKPKVLKTEYIVATLSFKGCVDGSWHRVWKTDTYEENPEIIKRTGYVVGDYQCSNNEIKFYVDSFSSYTTEEIDALKVSLTYYFDMERGSGMQNYTGAFTMTDVGTEDIAGIAGQARHFTRSQSDRINTTLTKFFTVGEDGTVSLWVKKDSTADMNIYTEHLSTGALTNIRSTTLTNLNTRMLGGNEPQYTTARSNGVWYNYVIVKNGTQHMFYVNGVYVMNGTVGSTESTGITLGSTFYLGAFYNKFDGTMDELYMYNRALSPAEINRLYNITFDGYNVYDYPTGTAPVQFALDGQYPLDLNTTNILQPIYINYTITGYNASLSTPYLNYTILSYDDECIIYTDGVCTQYNGTYVQTEAFTNTSTFFQFVTSTNDGVPAIFPYNASIMQSTSKSYQSADTNSVLKIDVENLNNVCSQAVLEGYFNASTTNVNLNIYYCNENYTTGNPSVNANCQIVGSFNNVSDTHHQHNMSFYDISYLDFCGENLTIPFSSTGSFLFRPQSDTPRLAYIATDTGASYISNNNGASYSSVTGTYDIKFHHWDGDLNFTYYACGTGVDTNFNCSSIESNLLNVEDTPKIAPIVEILVPYDNSTFTSTESIFLQWSGFDINDDALTYNVSINSVPILTDSVLTNYTIPAGLYTGAVIIEVIADDGTAIDTDSITITITLVSTGGGITDEQIADLVGNITAAGELTAGTVIMNNVWLMLIFLSLLGIGMILLIKR